MKNIIKKSISALLVVCIVLLILCIGYLVWFKYFTVPEEMGAIQDAMVAPGVSSVNTEPNFFEDAP